MKSPFVLLSTLLLFLMTSVSSDLYGTRLTEKDRIRIRKELRLDAWNVSEVEENSVRVFLGDNGFGSFKNDDKKTLGPNTQYIEDLSEWMIDGEKSDPASTTTHGLDMAMGLKGILGVKEDWNQLTCVNTNYLPNFSAFIKMATEKKADVVLYSNVWPGYGNGLRKDKKNFLNEMVHEYTRAGGIWLNSSGDYEWENLTLPIELAGDSSVKSKAKADTHYAVRIPKGKETGESVNTLVELRSFSDNNDVSVYLSWDDFGGTEHWSDVDLDFAIYNRNGVELVDSVNNQKGRPDIDAGDDTEKFTKHSREVIRDFILEGPDSERVSYKTYWLQITVKKESRQKIENGDFKFRLVVHPRKIGKVKMLPASEENDFYPPSTSDEVITVSAYDPKISKVTKNKSFKKPDIFMPNVDLSFTDGETRVTKSSPANAAMFGAVVATMKAYYPEITTSHLKDYFDYLHDKQLMRRLLSSNLTLVQGITETGVMGKNDSRWGRVLTRALTFVPDQADSQNSMRQPGPMGGAPHMGGAPMQGGMAPPPMPPPHPGMGMGPQGGMTPPSVEEIDQVVAEMLESGRGTTESGKSVLRFTKLDNRHQWILQQLESDAKDVLPDSSHFVLFDQKLQVPVLFIEEDLADLDLFDGQEVVGENPVWVVAIVGNGTGFDLRGFILDEKDLNRFQQFSYIKIEQIPDHASPVIWETPLPGEFKKLVLSSKSDK